MADTELIQAERDAVAVLGLLAHCWIRFDSPVPFPGDSATSHVAGLNIHGALIDHVDGDVLGLASNSIHADGSPVQHAEQRVLREAIDALAAKRPRKAHESIERYYRTQMFMAEGATPRDFLDGGATLYTTLEPCPMCATTALVCRVKRLVYIIPDDKYGGAWTYVKDRFYSADPSTYLPASIGEHGSGWADEVGALHARLCLRAKELKSSGVRDTHVLDHCRSELEEAFNMILATNPGDLVSLQQGDRRNARSLAGFKRRLGMPSLEA